ncbi:MAG TPA: hypothetical protein VLH79_15920 [Chthonomonadales bacterium]|nr:hypothetical protein [Chthonomonadales bacterium]
MRSVGSQRGVRKLEGGADSRGLIACLLAAGWLAVPALQYLGTLQRTNLLLHGDTALPALAEIDLSPLYVLLLLGSIAYAVLARPASARPERHTRG